MRIAALSFALILASSAPLRAQPKPLSTTKLVRLTVSSTPDKPLSFLGATIGSIVVEGIEKNVIDFYYAYVLSKMCECGLLDRFQCRDSLMRRGMLTYIQSSATATPYLLSAAVKGSDDFRTILNTPKTDSTGRPRKLQCDEDVCLKVCGAKICLLYECDDYSVEVCYNGTFSATVSDGTFSVTFPKQ